MKKLIYIAVVLTFTFIGRCYWTYVADALHAFDWIYLKPLNFHSILGTIIFVMFDFALLFYLLYIKYRRKKTQIKFSTLQKMTLTIVLTLFIEITINGIFLTYLSGDWGPWYSLFGLSYPFTLSLTILITFLWIFVDKNINKRYTDEHIIGIYLVMCIFTI